MPGKPGRRVSPEGLTPSETYYTANSTCSASLRPDWLAADRRSSNISWASDNGWGTGIALESLKLNKISQAARPWLLFVPGPVLALHVRFVFGGWYAVLPGVPGPAPASTWPECSSSVGVQGCGV